MNKTQILLFALVLCRPECVVRCAGVVGAGAPCQNSLFAPHFGRGTEPDADDLRNAHYVEQVHVIVRGADVAVLEYLADVKKVRSASPSSPNAHRAPGWRHEGTCF